jgi:hypothetical protein
MDDDIEDYKLNANFDHEAGYVVHTSWEPDYARGMRKTKVEDRWRRGKEIGFGSFGTVFLETTENGQQRAIKTIRKEVWL